MLVLRIISRHLYQLFLTSLLLRDLLRVASKGLAVVSSLCSLGSFDSRAHINLILTTSLNIIQFVILMR